MTHPFDGEGLTYSDRIKFWDDIADSYSSVQQGPMIFDIIHRLSAAGILSPGSSVLELGSGPGTYSLNIATRVCELTCVDSSPRMTERLMNGAERLNIRNITTIVSDFFDLGTHKKYDAVIATLCPGAGTPEGIAKMMSLSKDHCVHIMWMRNSWDDMHARIWRILGKEYSFGGRMSDAVPEHLRSIGNDPEVLEFSTEVELSMPFGDAVRKETEAFAAYGLVGADVSAAVERVLSKMNDRGMFRYTGNNAMRMVIWRQHG
jgi:SAM-dependent methyltransferase